MVKVRDKGKKRAEDNKKNKSEAEKKQQTKKAGAANTGPIFYFSNKTVTKECKKDKEDIERACSEKDKKQKKKGSDNQAIGSAGRATAKLGAVYNKVKDGVDALDEGAKTLYKYPKAPTGNNAWLNTHCKGLWVKPGGGKGDSNNIEKFKEQLAGIQDKFKDQAIELAKKEGWVVVKKGADTVVAAGEKALIREGAALLTLEIPVVGEIAVIGATIWGIVDGVKAAIDVTTLVLNKGPEILLKVMELWGQADKIGEILKTKEGMNDLMADIMTITAEANPCVRARKCSLVPYDETKTADGQAKTGKGCCPGQTGHHLLPDAMFREPGAEKAGSGRDSKPPLKCWAKYTEGGAPTICLEGTSNNPTNGSHGAFHLASEKIIAPIRNRTATMAYPEARDEMARMTSLVYGCSADCIKAQLDAYYKKAYSCNDFQEAQVVPHSGNSAGRPKKDSKPTKSGSNTKRKKK